MIIIPGKACWPQLVAASELIIGRAAEQAVPASRYPQV